MGSSQRLTVADLGLIYVSSYSGSVDPLPTWRPHPASSVAPCCYLSEAEESNRRHLGLEFTGVRHVHTIDEGKPPGLRLH